MPQDTDYLTKLLGPKLTADDEQGDPQATAQTDLATSLQGLMGDEGGDETADSDPIKKLLTAPPSAPLAQARKPISTLGY